MSEYLAASVDELVDIATLKLPDSTTPAEAVTALERIRQHHRDRMQQAERMVGRSHDYERWNERSAHHRARRDHAAALIRRFRAEAQRGNIPPEKWAVMNRAERRAAGGGR